MTKKHEKHMSNKNKTKPKTPSARRKPLLTKSMELPAIYYQPNGSYWRQDDHGRWIKINSGSARRFIEFSGYSNTRTAGISAVEKCLQDIQSRQNIAYAGPLAGHKAGHYLINGRGVLVTESPSLIEPQPGEWPLIRMLLDGLLPGDQHGQQQYLYGWLKKATEAVYSGKWTPGQMLAMVGPGDSGKSLLQNLITWMLGGRGAKPHDFMTGATTFNLDLFEAEHLMLEDDAEQVTWDKRRHLATQLKKLCVNQTQRGHGKNRDGLMLTPIWRLTCSVNDDPPQCMLVLPPLEKDVQDKIIILKVRKAQMPLPTDTADDYEALMAKLVAELPAFLHFLREWQIPGSLRHSRFGIKAFHHPEVVEVLWRVTPEAQLLDLVDQACFIDAGATWQGTAVELQELLERDKRAGRAARRLLKDATACGACLEKLAANPKTKARFTKVIEGQTVRWSIRCFGEQAADVLSDTKSASVPAHASVTTRARLHPVLRAAVSAPSEPARLQLMLPEKASGPVVADLKPCHPGRGNDFDSALKLIQILLHDRFQQ